jgi:hypothetical protein
MGRPALAAGFVIMALSAAPCTAQVRTQNLGLFGIGRGETARLNAVNANLGSVCGVQLQFVQPDGTVAKEIQSTLGPNDAVALEIARGRQSNTPPRQRYRAVVRQNGDANCRATLELFDNKSGASRGLVGNFD